MKRNHGDKNRLDSQSAVTKTTFVFSACLFLVSKFSRASKDLKNLYVCYDVTFSWTQSSSKNILSTPSRYIQVSYMKQWCHTWKGGGTDDVTTDDVMTMTYYTCARVKFDRFKDDS